MKERFSDLSEKVRNDADTLKAKIVSRYGLGEDDADAIVADIAGLEAHLVAACQTEKPNVPSTGRSKSKRRRGKAQREAACDQLLACVLHDKGDYACCRGFQGGRAFCIASTVAGRVFTRRIWSRLLSHFGGDAARSGGGPATAAGRGGGPPA